jgi:hypothetical protein
MGLVYSGRVARGVSSNVEGLPLDSLILVSETTVGKENKARIDEGCEY